MAIMPSFQVGYAGSIPVTRLLKNKFGALKKYLYFCILKYKIMKVKVFENEYGKKYKIKFELEFYFPSSDWDEQNVDITIEEALTLALDNSRKDLGEKVLNAEATAEVITE